VGGLDVEDWFDFRFMEEGWELILLRDALGE